MCNEGRRGIFKAPKGVVSEGTAPCTRVYREEPSIPEDKRSFWLLQVCRPGMLHTRYTQRGAEIGYAPEFIPQLPGKEKGYKPTGGLTSCQPCVSETDMSEDQDEC